jgi:hypothetical protein
VSHLVSRAAEAPGVFVTVSLFKRRRSTVKGDFERAFGLVVVDEDGGENAMGPGMMNESEHGWLVADETAAVAFEGFEDEGFEIAEVIVDDAIDFAGEGMAVVQAVV